MTKEQELAFNKLIEFSKDLESIDYAEIKTVISKSIKQVPIATAFIRKGQYIDRVRVNKDNKLFTKEDCISYIKDQYVIDNCLTEFGRANRPNQVMFYGALESSEIQQPRVTAIFETSQLLKDRESINIEGELLTVSRWKVLEDILLIEIVFDEDAIRKNPDIRQSFNHHIEEISYHPLRELGLRQIKFFSNEFAKTADSHWDYKISVAYTDLILHDKRPSINGFPIEGIAYPSVPSDHKGQNVVLRQDVVDRKLELEAVATQVIHKNKLKHFVNNHKYVSDFGKNNSNFTWSDIAPEYVVSLEDVKKNNLGINE